MTVTLVKDIQCDAMQLSQLFKYNVNKQITNTNR